MGLGSSRAAGGADAADDGGEGGGAEQYRYPPPTGLYFGNQFVMGAQTFPALDPDAFLFGDLSDLNFLSHIPGAMPRVPPNIKHTNTIRSLVNVHKDSLKLVRHAMHDEPLDEYHLEFSFDADVACKVTVLYFGQEVCNKSGHVDYRPAPVQQGTEAARPTTLEPSPVFFDAGMNQAYSCPAQSTIKGLSTFAPEALFFSTDTAESPTRNGAAAMRFPVVIVIEANPERMESRRRSFAAAHAATSAEPDADGNRGNVLHAHTHATIATFEQSRPEPDCPFTVKPLVQKINVDGLSYILKEIYGIEQKEDGEEEVDEEDDDSTECVVCMSESKDTMVLPCRHLCLCNPCAEVLRYQANKCPICRAPFHSLLQIRVSQKLDGDAEEEDVDEDAPPNYRLVPVSEALRSSRTRAAGGGAAASPPQDAAPASNRAPAGDPASNRPPTLTVAAADAGSTDVDEDTRASRDSYLEIAAADESDFHPSNSVIPCPAEPILVLASAESDEADSVTTHRARRVSVLSRVTVEDENADENDPLMVQRQPSVPELEASASSAELTLPGTPEGSRHGSICENRAV